MSSADDRNNNSNAAAPRGRRGGSRAFRGRTRGRGFHFDLNAQMALKQHLMCRGRGLQLPAIDVSSLAIGNYHDAPLNARKIDKNVYPIAADRTNIIETDPIYIYHPTPRQTGLLHPTGEMMSLAHPFCKGYISFHYTPSRPTEPSRPHPPVPGTQSGPSREQVPHGRTLG